MDLKTHALKGAVKADCLKAQSRPTVLKSELCLCLQEPAPTPVEKQEKQEKQDGEQVSVS